MGWERSRILYFIVLPGLLAGGIYAVLRAADARQVKEDQLWQHRNLGKAFYENPTTRAEAVEEFRKALQLAPDSLRDRLNYGLALMRAGKEKEGAAELERVERADPKLLHTWFNLGIYYRKIRQYAAAIRQLEQMVKLAPQDAPSHFNLADVYLFQGRIEDALKEFRIASSLDPNFAAPIFKMFNIYREADRMREAKQALDAFQKVKSRQQAPDVPAEDTQWGYFAELYDPAPQNTGKEGRAAEVRFQDRRLSGKVDAKSTGAIAVDIHGDGSSDVLVWSSSGIAVYVHGSKETDVGLGGLKNVISVAAGDYNNDGLVDLCVLTDSGASLYHNEHGRFHKDAVTLPSGRFEKALWLDYDHDYDLDLFLFGAHSVLLRNQGSAGFEVRPSDFPFAGGTAVDTAAFRMIPDSRGIDLAVSYRDHAGVLYRDQLGGVFTATPLAEMPAGSRRIIPVDIDNNGAVDLAFTTADRLTILKNREGRFEAMKVDAAAGPVVFADLENRGWADLISARGVHRNLGQDHFSPARMPAGFTPGVVWAPLGSNLAAVAADGSVHVLDNVARGAGHWLEVGLAGVRNLKMPLGAEVEVKAGSDYQKKIYAGVPLLFGAGQHRQVDTVRVTWPNGLIQNEVRQPVDRRITIVEAPRLAGSCPMIFTWNGREFEFVTDVLGVAPLGASSGDGKYFPVDHDEYVQIPGEALKPSDGAFEVRITEELSEVSYLDEVRLIAVDHPREVEVYTNDKWKGPPFPEFRLFGVRRRVPPIAAGQNGRNVLPALLNRDRVYADGFGRNYAGVAEEHSLVLDFGREAARDNRAVLVLNGWVDWADGSTFLAASQESRTGLVPPSLQVLDAQGQWRTVIEDMGMPSGKTKSIAVDLTGKFLSASRKVRIVTNLCVYWDEIFLSEDEGPPETRLTAMDAASAELRFHGFSKPRIHPRRKLPEFFDYSRVTAASSWNPTPGFYTRYGDVRELIGKVDDRFVIMGSGDELQIRFPASGLPPLPAGWKRDFLLLVDGWAKDRDANTAYSQTVEPLPFHAMSAYPYPAPQRYPTDAAHAAYRTEYNTRPGLRLMPSLVE